jgi:hypothetical protein
MQDRLRFDLNGISRICVGLLWLTVLAEVIYAANSYGMRAFLNDLESGALVGAALNSEAERLDFQAKIVGFGYLAIFVLCVIFSGVWIYRASWNAREIQPNDARITPGWAVGWFFVPIMSFWKPYQAIVQTGNSSEDPTGRNQSRGQLFVPALDESGNDRRLPPDHHDRPCMRPAVHPGGTAVHEADQDHNRRAARQETRLAES